jgi:hypothetical protein
MPSKKIKSLHYNLDFQDPYLGGPNVVFHRSHRSKNGQRAYKTTKKKELWDFLLEKTEKYTQKEEKKWKDLHFK